LADQVRPHLRGFVVGLATGILGNAAILVLPQPFRDYLGYFGIGVYLLVAVGLFVWLVLILRNRVRIRADSVRRLLDRLLLPGAVALWIGVQALFGPGVLALALVVLVAALLATWGVSELRRWWKERRHKPSHG
jgi:hypothetical protein